LLFTLNLIWTQLEQRKKGHSNGFCGCLHGV
jgi:hypothetical protein